MFAFPSCMKKLPELSDAECALQKISIPETRPEPAASIGDSSACGVKGVWGGSCGYFKCASTFIQDLSSVKCVYFYFYFYKLFSRLDTFFFFSSKLRWKAALRSHTFARFSTRSQRGLFKNETSSRTAKRPCHHFLQWELI